MPSVCDRCTKKDRCNKAFACHRVEYQEVLNWRAEYDERRIARQG